MIVYYFGQVSFLSRQTFALIIAYRYYNITTQASEKGIHEKSG